MGEEAKEGIVLASERVREYEEVERIERKRRM